ncbi:MAG: hypothetical protein M3P42_01975 [Actinomycetota bacterium]|nr:hypothetical protein [Actinomycetota bacterium]
MSEPAGGVSGGFMYMVADEDRRPVEELYALFRRTPESSRGHLLMTGLRRPDDALYAKPFRLTGVDFRLVPDGGGGTTEAVDSDGLTMAFEQEFDGAPLLVYGLVADHVTAVEVLISGKPRPARLENNAYAALVDAEVDDFEGVVLHRADGTSVRV